MSNSIRKFWNLWSKVEGILDKDHLTAVTNTAILHMKEHPGNTQLEKTVGRMKIAGFRNFLHAPQNRQVRELVSWVEKDKTRINFLPILEAWVTVEEDLYAQVVQNLQDNLINLPGLKQKVESYETALVNKEINTLVSSLSFASDYRDQDIKLMVCCVVGGELDEIDSEEVVEQSNVEQFIAAPANNEVVNGDINVMWDGWLENLRNLPADAVEWTCLEEFIEELQQIAQEKSQIREQWAVHLKLIANVLENIGKLSDGYGCELDFFDITFGSSEAIQQLTDPEIMQLEEKITNLQLNFDTYRGLKQMPVNKAIEEQRKFSEISNISQKIFQLATEIPGV